MSPATVCPPAVRRFCLPKGCYTFSAFAALFPSEACIGFQIRNSTAPKAGCYDFELLKSFDVLILAIGNKICKRNIS